MKRNFYFLVAVMTILVGVVSIAQAGDAAKLDGKSFDVETNGPDTKDDPDKLVFAEGKLNSTGCEEWGFSSAPYKVTAADHGLAFSATTKSVKEGLIVWSGTVHPDGKIRGSYKWTKGERTLEYTFNGTQAK
jgi:hypothetical protein